MAEADPEQLGHTGRQRGWQGPGVLSYGYRPFFLLAGLWAALAMTIWIAMFAGAGQLPTRFDPVSWHAHEMLFGYLGAVMAGFLLTAVPNWTGRMPIIGWPLAGLTAVWLCGRIAIAISAILPPWLVAVVDLAFPAVLAIVIAREILAGKNWRNLIVLALLLLFMIANGLFHALAVAGAYAAGSVGFRMGLAVAVMLLSLIGGRIVPSFTRNWLVKQGLVAKPAAVGRLDKLTLIATLVCLSLWTVLPENIVTAYLSLAAGILHLVRLARWSGWRALPEPLLWILHVGYFFVPLGFVAIGLSALDLEVSPPVGALHIWMAGAIGVMTLAVMTRASLGHAGRPLSATPAVTAVYLLVLGSIALRFIASFDVAPVWILYTSAGAWIAGFAGFCVLYWPILTARR